MSFNFRIEGLDEAIKEIEKLQKGTSLEYLELWCSRISNDVKLRASDEDIKSFIFDAKLGEDNNPQFELNFTEGIGGLLIDIIKGYLSEMPITTRVVFEKLINIIEKKVSSGL